MSRNALKARAKTLKKENAAKKLKQKKAFILGICVLAVLAAVGFFINSIIHSKNTEKQDSEIYSYGGQTVQLFADGKFTASLAHNVSKNGTYTKEAESDIIAISFIINGRTEIGRIINNALHLPKEWDDGHNHGNIFPKVDKVPSSNHQGHSH